MRQGRRLLRVYDMPHKGLVWRILAVRPEGRYDSHESSNDDNSLGTVIVIDHVLGKKTYFANDACQYSNVEVIDRWSETASDWGVRLR